MLDNVLTYKRSNARVSHRVIERVSKYKQESASISKGCRKVGETYNTKVHVPQTYNNVHLVSHGQALFSYWNHFYLITIRNCFI